MKSSSRLRTSKVKLGELRIEIAGMSDPGSSRANQDAWITLLPKWFHHKPVLIVVADGMGGHLSGGLASQIIVKTFRTSYRTYSHDVAPEPFLEGVLRTAHKRIRDQGFRGPDSRGMGSTVVAGLITDKEVSLVNVGDSRGYLIRDSEIFRLTFDHSWVEEQVRSGILTELEAQKHPKRNQLTMSISSRRSESEVEPFFSHFEPVCGDGLLLCTDGLWGVISEEEISAIVTELSTEGAVRKLINMANISQGTDNITVVLSKWVCS